MMKNKKLAALLGLLLAGSMTVSHANDSYFWVVSQFSDMETKDAYKCQTGMTGVMGIVTIIIVFILSLVFCGVHS